MRLRARSSSLLALAFCAFALPISGIAAEEAEKSGEQKAAAVVAKGRNVSIEFTLSDDAGKVTETNVGKKPLVYEHGSGTMLPALEAALVGLAAGATKAVDLTAEQGYGPVRQDLFHTVDATSIPEQARSVGSVVIAQSQAGEQRPVRVHEVNGDKIVLDMNHPLAGKKLHFAIKILSVE
jgi:FKBP-type peptidyl-prolyl cis-trans isomerase SlyD